MHKTSFLAQHFRDAPSSARNRSSGGGIKPGAEPPAPSGRLAPGRLTLRSSTPGFTTAGILLLTTLLALDGWAALDWRFEAPDPDEAPACSGWCGFVRLSGGTADDKLCSTTMPVPCVMQVWASVGLNSDTNNFGCGSLFLWHEKGEVTWSLVPKGGGPTPKGLYIQELGPSANNTAPYWALIYAISATEVVAGTYEVLATPKQGDVWKGTVTVTKDECATGGAQCSARQAPVFGAPFIAMGSVSTRLNLGRFAFGKEIGALEVNAKYPTNLLSQPACLGFLYPHGTNNPDCEVIITNSASGIRQVKAPEGLANIITSNAYKYWINLHGSSAVSTNKGADGLYSVTGGPLATLTVENPDTSGATTNKLRVTDGDGVVSDYEWKTNGWELVQGGGLRNQFRTSLLTNNLRTTTLDVRGTNGLVTCSIRKYTNFAFGERLIEQVDGIGAEAATNSFEYYTNWVLNYQGLIKQDVYANGPWHQYAYETNGLKTNLISGFLNQSPTTDVSLARHTEYRYGSNAIPSAGDTGIRRPMEPRCVVDYVQGKEVARSYTVFLSKERRDIRCVTVGAQWDATDNLVTITKWYPDTHTNRLKSVELPDGTMTIHHYALFTNAAGDCFKTNIVLTGQPDSDKTNIIDGTKSIVAYGTVGQIYRRSRFDIASGLIVSDETYSDFDAYSRPRKTTYLDGTSTTTEHGCCGPESTTDREGTVTTFLRDPLKRHAATTRGGITTTNAMDPVGNILKTTRIGTDSSQITKTTYAYDSLGRRTAMTNALGQVTTYSDILTNFQRVLTTTHPDGGTRIESYYRDGQLAKLTGTAVHPLRYVPGVVQDGGLWRLSTAEIKLDANGNDTSETLTNFFDMLGRRYKTGFPDGSSRQSTFNVKGQLVKEVDPDGVTTLHAYNGRGELEVNAIDLNRNGTIDYAGEDRINKTLQTVTTAHGTNVQQSKSFVWATHGADSTNLTALSESSVDGRTWTASFGLTHSSHTYLGTNGNRYVTNTAPDGTYTVSHSTNGLLKSITRKTSGGTQLSQSTYFYDAHGRPYALTDARNGTTTYSFDNEDRRISQTSPPPGTGHSPQTTTYTLDWQGRVTRSVLPDGSSISNVYSPKGELLTNWGAQAYPVAYTYDPQGRRKSMVTWTNFASRSGAATTTWNYDGNRGFLSSKVYDGGIGTTNSYTAGGGLRTRTWARGVTTTYHTNAAGETFAITYSDGTPALTNYFDRLGRTTNIVDGSGSRFLSYADSGALLTESYASGLLANLSLSNSYDSLLRRTGLAFRTNTGAPILSYSYAYDSASRLTNTGDGTYSATYSYLANSPLVSQLVFRSGSTTRMTTTKQYDYLNRLQAITSAPGASGEPPVSFGYTYNHASQRTRVVMPDDTSWVYEYDALGQLTSGKRYWSDGTPVAGQQFEYGFDDIGNRLSTKAGGDENGAGLRTAAYAANSLNQHTSRDVPGAADILGIAHASAPVTVNSQAPSRRGEYFRKELSIDNSTSAVWQSVTNIASLGGTNQTNLGSLFLPKTAESFSYDADGNLTNDGRFRYVWDAENRMTLAESHSSAPSASKRKVTFDYDGGGRMARRIEYDGSSGSYVLTNDIKFARDGWQILAEMNGTTGQRLRSYLWGLDLSGSMTGAGGVGGLLAMNSASAGTHFHAMDGNGNVVALVSASDGSTSAAHEFDPFGQTLRRTGSAATENPFRFSTKRTDDALELVAYEYRSYNPSLGRWISRDPIEENGGLNTFGALRNDPADFTDSLGQCPELLFKETPGTSTDMRTKDHCRQTCGVETDPNGNVTRIIPACTKHHYDPNVKCVCCKKNVWRISAVITYRCNIYIADPSLPVTWTPSRAAGLAHERCHCEDARKALQAIIGEIAAIPAFSTKETCETRRNQINVKARFDLLMEPSTLHTDPKYKRRGKCFAEGDLKP